MKNTAIVLAAGSGKRMNSDIKKQYMMLAGKPVLYHSLKAMEESDVITDVVVVTSEEDKNYVLTDIVNKYKFTKVRDIVTGGKERYHSVMNGLDKITEKGGADYVFIHDGARPLITPDIISRLYDDVRVNETAIAAVKSKDTVKIASPSDIVVSTPNRSLVWIIQTPQVFSYSLIKEAYDVLKEEECGLPCSGINVTDDAMVVETFSGHKVKLTEASYENIKITTPEDLDIAELIIKRRQ